MSQPLNLSQRVTVLQTAPKTSPKKSLAQLALTVFLGSLAVAAALFLLLWATSQKIQAAPPIRPLLAVITNTTVITHTAATTHQMRVYANGRISNQFLDQNNQNQIDQDGNDITGTTIAVRFDQHTGDNVDVGVQGDFIPTTPITLYTSPHNNYPAYSEDSRVIYASKALSYQITQRTLATPANNCVIMELDIENTGSISLTEGKLLFMVNIDVALSENGDIGYYDPARRLVYLADENEAAPLYDGFAMGVALLQGSWRGYGINGDRNVFPPESYPITDFDIKNQMITPSNTITNLPADDHIVWIVANIPDLTSGQTTPLAFGLCAANGASRSEAQDELIDTFEKLVNLAVIKTATPASGSSVSVGQQITYTIALSNTGDRYVDNIVVTDAVPAATNLVTYSVSQGSITATGRLVTATVGRLYATSDTVTMTLVVAPVATTTPGVIITNQAFINSEPIITQTNLVTHELGTVGLTATKTATPTAGSSVLAGQQITYTIALSNTGEGYVDNIVVTDAVPAATDLITYSISQGSITATGRLVTATVGRLYATSDTVTMTLVVVPVATSTPGTIITNQAFINSEPIITQTNLVTHEFNTLGLTLTKTGPLTAAVGDSLVYSFTVALSGTKSVTAVMVTDSIAGNTGYSSGDVNSNNLLETGETWVYTAAYTIQPTDTHLLVNTGTVSGKDLSNNNVVATDTHTTTLSFDPQLVVVSSGPAVANLNETVVFTFIVINYDMQSLFLFGLDLINIASIGDGSPISITQVTDTLAGEAAYAFGDWNNNSTLDGGEGWVYTASYTIQAAAPNPLTGVVVAVGRDMEGDELTATSDVHFTYLNLPDAGNSTFMPIIFKNGP
ncbi:MAG: DUF11 domain-containing protein [Anaerolineae bacterium]|nr:DUF11 domain-containing protein [Anaerolineae bacterium]